MLYYYIQVFLPSENRSHQIKGLRRRQTNSSQNQHYCHGLQLSPMLKLHKNYPARCSIAVQNPVLRQGNYACIRSPNVSPQASKKDQAAFVDIRHFAADLSEDLSESEKCGS